MAFYKEKLITNQGFLVSKGYLKVSNFTYDRKGKGIIYQISIYPSREPGQAENEIGIFYYVGWLAIQNGESVPDILRMIYEDIKLKAQDAEKYPEIATKFADVTDVFEDDTPESPSYAELAAATNILMGGNET